MCVCMLLRNLLSLKLFILNVYFKMAASSGSHFGNIKSQYLKKIRIRFSCRLHKNVQFSKSFPFNVISCQSKFEVHQIMTEKLFNALKAKETLASGTMKVNGLPSGLGLDHPRAVFKPLKCPQLRLLLLKYHRMVNAYGFLPREMSGPKYLGTTLSQLAQKRTITETHFSLYEDFNWYNVATTRDFPARRDKSFEPGFP